MRCTCFGHFQTGFITCVHNDMLANMSHGFENLKIFASPDTPLYFFYFIKLGMKNSLKNVLNYCGCFARDLQTQYVRSVTMFYG